MVLHGVAPIEFRRQMLQLLLLHKMDSLVANGLSPTLTQSLFTSVSYTPNVRWLSDLFVHKVNKSLRQPSLRCVP